MLRLARRRYNLHSTNDRIRERKCGAVKGSITEIYTVFDGSSKRLVLPVYQRN